MGVRLARDRAHAEKVTGNGWPAPALPPRIRPKPGRRNSRAAAESTRRRLTMRTLDRTRTFPRAMLARGDTAPPGGHPRTPDGPGTPDGLRPLPAPLLAALRRSVAQPPAEQNDPVRPGHPEEPQVAGVAAEQPRQERDEADRGPGAPRRPPGGRYPGAAARREQPGQAKARTAAAPFHRMVGQVVQVDSRQVRQQLVQFSQGFGRIGLVEAFVELLGGQPACREVLTQQRGGTVTVRVRGADLGVTGHRPPPQLAGCGCAGSAVRMIIPSRAPVRAGAEAVSTHGPSAVMATVCSKWADHPPSSLTTVHPSSSSWVSGLPRTSSGSMARAMPSASTGPRPGLPRLGTDGSMCISVPMPWPT